MEQEIEQLQEKLEGINDRYRKGDFNFRFNRHLSIIRDILSRASVEARRMSRNETSEEDIERMEAWLIVIETVLEVFERKLDSDKRREKVLEAVGMDFYRRCDCPEISDPLVLNTEEEFVGRGRNVPVFDIKDSSNGLEFDSQETVPFVCAPDSWVEDSYLWPLIAHEFAHVLYDSPLPINKPQYPNSHAAEYFSDQIASHIVGPAYLKSMVSAFSEAENPDNPTEQHPPESDRINLVRRIVREREISQEMLDSLEERVLDWIEERDARDYVDRGSDFRLAEQDVERFLEDKEILDFEETWDRVENVEDLTPVDWLNHITSRQLEGEDVDVEPIEEDIIGWQRGVT